MFILIIVIKRLNSYLRLLMQDHLLLQNMVMYIHLYMDILILKLHFKILLLDQLR